VDARDVLGDARVNEDASAWYDVRDDAKGMEVKGGVVAKGGRETRDCAWEIVAKASASTEGKRWVVVVGWIYAPDGQDAGANAEGSAYEKVADDEAA
jgi:hypothetical protein